MNLCQVMDLGPLPSTPAWLSSQTASTPLRGRGFLFADGQTLGSSSDVVCSSEPPVGCLSLRPDGRVSHAILATAAREHPHAAGRRLRKTHREFLRWGQRPQDLAPQGRLGAMPGNTALLTM